MDSGACDEDGKWKTPDYYGCSVKCSEAALQRCF